MQAGGAQSRVHPETRMNAGEFHLRDTGSLRFGFCDLKISDSWDKYKRNYYGWFAHNSGFYLLAFPEISSISTLITVVL